MLSALYAVIIFFMTNQIFEPERFLKVVLVYILVTTVADGLGLILGASMDPIVREPNALYLASLFIKFPIYLEWNIYRCHRQRVQDCILWLSRAKQSHCKAHATANVPFVDELFLGSLGASTL